MLVHVHACIGVIQQQWMPLVCALGPTSKHRQSELQALEGKTQQDRQG